MAASEQKKEEQIPARRRSLLRLVLLGFAVSMLPVMVLIYQAGADISELSSLGESSARQAVDDTRRARMLVNLSSELERVARQYAVIQNDTLLHTYQERLEQFKHQFNLHVTRLGGFRLEGEVRRFLARMDSFSNDPQQIQSVISLFPDFDNDVYAMEVTTNDLVDARLQEMRERASDIYSSLWIKLAITLILSLLAIIYFTWRITRPIHQLEQRILSLGTDQRNVRGEISGPAELAQLGHRLDWLGDRLDELESQKRSFLRHMSHELKTPLAAIREGTGLLADGIVGSLGKRQREIVLLIDDSGAELQTLIEQLLDYNQVQQNHTLTITRFDVVTLVHEIIGKHRLAFESKGQRLDLPRRPVYWQADRVRTGRIIDNLVSNVIAYGDDRGTLWARAWNDDNFLYVEIANSGVAISEKDSEHLFEPFYQGASRRKGPLKGSGIGLSVAAESAQLQGGTLELLKDAKEDVCFRLMLPRAELG